MPPKTYVVDVGVQKDLENVRKTVTDFDMSEVEKIMNKRAINEKIVEEWQDKADQRKTVVFCSTLIMHKMFVMSLDVKILEQKLLLVTHQANKENKFYMI